MQPEGVKSVIEKLDCIKTLRSDGIRNQDLYRIKDLIGPLVAYFINSCVKHSEYPNELKNR